MRLSLTLLWASLAATSADIRGHRQTQATTVGSVTKLRIVDADKNQAIAGLDPASGSVTIDLTVLSAEYLNIQAFTTGTVGSLKWDLNGTVRSEYSAPWAFCGNSDSDFFACSELVEGFNLTIKVTPYSKGKAGTSSSVAIHIVRSRPQMNLTLMNADSDTPMGVLANDTTINLAETPSINIRADIPNGLSVRSVRFWYNGKIFRTENGAHYAFNGNDGDNFFAFAPAVGCHTVTARAYSERDARGKVRASESVTWCVDFQTPAPTSTPTMFPVATAPTPYSCDSTTDTCKYKFDDMCDGGPEDTEWCDANTDCFDCDPCRTYAYTSCGECTQAPEECVWCEADLSCKSPGTVVAAPLSCAASDYDTTCTTQPTTGLFSDPFYNHMSWIFDMIKVVDVWKSGVTGKGIGIRINDMGVDSSHPEFAHRFDIEGSCSIYEPAVWDADHNHGTACASLAAGSANSSCTVGIAPDARIGSCRMLLSSAEDVTAPEADDSSFLYTNMTNMQISSNSYGRLTCTKKRRRKLEEQTCPFLSNSTLSPCRSDACAGVDWMETGPNPECESAVLAYCSKRVNYEHDVAGCASFLDLFVNCEYNNQDVDELNAMIEGIANGRDGKGIVYIFASGNAFYAGAAVNFEGTLNSRFVMSVGAVGRDKVHSSFSTPGAALMVSAPGGDFETKPNNIVALAGGGCTDGGVGTSYACPIVAGVVALMLQVNENLTWRDVQGIIATTSQKVYPLHQSWTTNAAGLHHSNLYGFGIVDASAAVQAAKTWVNYGSERQIIAGSGSVNLPVADFQTPTVSTISSINISAPANFKVESVNVYVDLSHASRGDLDIELVSPQGMVSLLAPGQRPENSQLAEDERWRLLTVRNWGESASGEWQLRLTDRQRGDVASCVNVVGYSVDVVFPFGTIPVNCFDLETFGACEGGAESPTYGETFFVDLAPGINDPVYTMANGLTAAKACCACGGGKQASDIPDVLKSWRLAVYGHVM